MRELDLAHMLCSDDALGLVRRGVPNSCGKQQNEGCLPVTHSVMREQCSSLIAAYEAIRVTHSVMRKQYS